MEYKEEWNMNDIESVLVYMKKHPIKAYEYCGRCIRNITEELSGFTCLKSYIKDWYYYILHSSKSRFMFNRQMRTSKHLVKVLGNNYYSAILLRPENWSPRIDIILRRKDNKNVDYDKLESIIEKFDSKWLNKISLDQYDLTLSDEPLLDEDLAEDKRLEDRFFERLRFNLEDTDEDANEIIWCNCRDLVEIKTTD